MKKIICTTLLVTLLSGSLVSNAIAGPSGNTSETSMLSLDISGPFSIVFVPVIVSGIAASAVSESLTLLGEIGNSISVKKVEHQQTNTVVYGTATEKNTQKPVDVKFALPNTVANKANIQEGKDVKLQETPMGTLVTYDNQSLGFAAGTQKQNNMKSVKIK